MAMISRARRALAVLVLVAALSLSGSQPAGASSSYCGYGTTYDWWGRVQEVYLYTTYNVGYGGTYEHVVEHREYSWSWYYWGWITWTHHDSVWCP